MSNKFICAIGVSLVALMCISACKKDPVTDAPKVPPAESDPPAVADPMTLPDCATATDAFATLSGPRIRITLNADGSINQVEGKDGQHNWEPEVMSQTAAPASLGGCIARIEIHVHDGSNNELVNASGDSLHSHAGLSNPPYNTHCHRWVVGQNNVKYLAHCS